MMQPLITACWIALGVMVQEPEPALPEVPSGFVIELIAEAPEIRWPSAVHCLDDGSLLVAEDPMDMTGPTDQPIDRIWLFRWNADGTRTKTVFAENLYAVFGLQQIDDAVYVMNMPYLTVLRDRDGNGVADERFELLRDLGPPAPGWPGGFNDHIVTGIRLGLDGFIYVSVGDKGVPKATGTDGQTITLRGGGVVRVRPDGTGLEVVASGTRNHLDVAMDSKGNVFTYDNTDDGLGWWTRFTHIVRGGYYGYPWDYHDHRDRMLEPMADYGGGSPVGGLVYRGGAWPFEYDDNILFCEWGKGTVRRFTLRPEGSTFAVASAEDFVKAGPVDSFRPLDICESPDGRFVYIADWGYPGWRKPDVTGRLYRLRRADDDGRPTAAPIPSLTHASFRQRLLAQRAAVRRGVAAVPNLRHLVIHSRSTRAKRHAVWALAAIGSAEARQAVLAALSDDEADTRAQAARALGEGLLDDAAPLLPLLMDADPVVVRHAASALGRIGDPAATAPLLLRLRREQDAFLAFTLRQAIQRLDHWAPVVAALSTSPSTELDSLLLTMHDQFSTGLADGLMELVRSGARDDRRARALVQLAHLHRRLPAWDGTWWLTQPARTPRPTPEVDWERTSAISETVRAAFHDPAAPVRAAAVEAVSITADRTALPEVRRLAEDKDPRVRLAGLRLLGTLRDADPGTLDRVQRTIEDTASTSELLTAAITTLRQIDSPEARARLIAVALADGAKREVVIPALEALGQIGTGDIAAQLRPLAQHASPAIRVATLSALDAIGAAECRPEARPLLADPDASVRREAARVCAALQDSEAIPVLISLVESDPDTRDAAIDALTALPDVRALDAYLLGLADPGAGRRLMAQRALSAIRQEVRGQLEARQLRGELPSAVLAAVRSVYQDPQPVREWHLLGPFEKKSDPPASVPAPFVQDGAPVLSPIPGGPEAWEAHTTDRPHGFVDLRARMTPNSSTVAYAATWIDSPTTRRAQAAVGSDDQVAVWVNGELVHDYPGARGWTPDQDRFEVRLKPGPNAIVVRVGQDGGDWSFNFKLSDAATGPLFELGDAISLEQADYRQYAIEHAGDVSLGRAIFRDRDGVGCVSCHVAEGVGERVGPELSDVGAKYPRTEIVTSILEPSQRIGEGYRAIGVEHEDGRLLFGLPKTEEDGRLSIVNSQGKTITIRTGEIAERWTSPLSPMPNGLQSGLTLEQFAHLVAYLESLTTPTEDSGNHR